MMLGWAVAALLLALLIVLALAYRRLRNDLRREQMEIARLNNRLAHIQTELAELNARRKKLLSAATQGLVIVERDFTISSANKVARRMFGRKPKKDTTLMTWTRQHQLQELVERTLEGEKMPPVHFTFNDRNLEAQARAIKQNKQRVAVARALVNEPAVLLADEPSGNLDTETSGRLHDLLFELQRDRDLSLVVVTHNLDLASRADRSLVLAGGRLHPGTEG